MAYYCNRCETNWSTAKFRLADPELTHLHCPECTSIEQVSALQLQAEVKQLRKIIKNLDGERRHWYKKLEKSQADMQRLMRAVWVDEDGDEDDLGTMEEVIEEVNRLNKGDWEAYKQALEGE